MNRPAALPARVPPPPREAPGDGSPSAPALAPAGIPRLSPPGLPSPLTPGGARLPRRPVPRPPRQERMPFPHTHAHTPDARLPAEGGGGTAFPRGAERRRPELTSRPAGPRLGRSPAPAAPGERHRLPPSRKERRGPEASRAFPPPSLPLSLPPPFPIAARTEPKPGRKLPRWPQQWGKGGEAPPGPARCRCESRPEPRRLCRPATCPGGSAGTGGGVGEDEEHEPRRSRREGARGAAAA